MFVSDGHVVLDILLIQSYYDVRGASEKVNFWVIAGSSAQAAAGSWNHRYVLLCIKGRVTTQVLLSVGPHAIDTK